MTIRNTLQPAFLAEGVIRAGVAAEAGEAAKDLHHVAPVEQAGGVFLPLAVESLGVWTSHSLATLKKIAARTTTASGLTAKRALQNLLHQLSVRLWQFNARLLRSRLQVLDDVVGWDLPGKPSFAHMDVLYIVLVVSLFSLTIVCMFAPISLLCAVVHILSSYLVVCSSGVLPSISLLPVAPFVNYVPLLTRSSFSRTVTLVQTKSSLSKPVHVVSLREGSHINTQSAVYTVRPYTSVYCIFCFTFGA